MADITQISLNGSVYDLRDKKWLDSITNCITEIPQDINLELDSGTLTLKAGSKVYVPNGAGVFNTVTTTADITANSPWGGGSDDVMLFVNGTSFSGIVATRCYSGASQPTVSGGTDAFWYDTANNVIKKTTDTGATWTETTYSLPIAIFSRVSGTITAIKQVFNGFGFIGNTVFALPGVKGLIPDGRNSDGTLKSTAIAPNSVITRTFTSAYSGYYDFFIDNNSFSGLKNTYTYDEINNRNKDGSNNFNYAYIGTAKLTSGVVNQFNPKTAFHAVDYNDTEFIAHQAMPSDRYVDLTLPASGGSITAPADGYIVLAKKSGAANEFVSISGVVESLQTSYTTNQILLACVPVSKGQTPKVFYNATGTTTYFKFVYTNGAK